MSARRPLLAAAAVGVTALVVPAHAMAPGDQYQSFNQTDPWIVDRFTGLRWQRAPVAVPRTQQEAIAICDAAQARLPSVKELQTLVDESPHDEYDVSAGKNVYKYIDGYAFPQTPTNSAYWTSSFKGADTSTALVVRFDQGTTGELQTTTPGGFVRCVK